MASCLAPAPCFLAARRLAQEPGPPQQRLALDDAMARVLGKGHATVRIGSLCHCDARRIPRTRATPRGGDLPSASRRPRRRFRSAPALVDPSSAAASGSGLSPKAPFCWSTRRIHEGSCPISGVGLGLRGVSRADEHRRIGLNWEGSWTRAYSAVNVSIAAR